MYRAYSHQQIAAAVANDGGGVTGTANITLGAFTSTAAGTLTVAGSASVSIGGMTTAATGITAVAGEATFTFDAMAIAAAGSTAVTAFSDVTFGAVTVSGAGVAGGISGSAALTFGAMATTATGTVTIDGSASIGFGAMGVDGEGTVAGAVIFVRSRGISRESAASAILAESGPSRPPRPVISALGGDYTVTGSFADSGLSVNLSRRGYWLISTTLRVDHDAASGDLEARLVCDGTAQSGVVVLGSLTPLASIAGQWVYQNKSGAEAKLQARKTIGAGTSLLKATDSTMSAIWTGP